jgi:hypothetical protein
MFVIRISYTPVLFSRFRDRIDVETAELEIRRTCPEGIRFVDTPAAQPFTITSRSMLSGNVLGECREAQCGVEARIGPARQPRYGLEACCDAHCRSDPLPNRNNAT